MKRIILAVFMVLCVAQLASAQTGVRIFGAQQFMLDDNTFANSKVYLSANNGSMGIDQNGFVTGTFPNATSMLTILAGTKTFGLKIDGGATWGLDIVNTNNGIRSAGRNFFGDGAGVDDNVFNIGGGNLIINTLPAPALPGPLSNVMYVNVSNQVQQTPGGVNIVTGSGTVGTVPLWTPTGFQIGNSILTQTANTGINVIPGVATTNNVLVVNGVNDATVASVAGNTVWDSRINGDQLVTGVQKIGGSIWLDGNSATHQIVTDAPVNIGSKNGSTVSFVTNNTARMSINSAGSIDIPTSTAAGVGIITQNGSRLIHNSGPLGFFAGFNAGNLSNSGFGNTGLGAQALFNNTTGGGNTAIGLSSLFKSVSGGQNTALGTETLPENITNSSNTAIGYRALFKSISDNNTAVGSTALLNTTSGGSNTALGQNTGNTNTTGSGNTFLGAGADASVNNLTNATAIGSGAVVSQSSTIVLGSGQRVGIGVSNPGSLLANTNANIVDQGGDGLTGGSIAWQYNNGGYIVGLENTNVAAVNPHGLLVKTDKTTAATRIFVANSGPGNGTDRFTVQGDGIVKMGSSFVAGGDENLKTIRGIFDLNANIVSGSGYTVVRNGVGDWQVTFTNAFADIPAISFSTNFNPLFVVWNTLGNGGVNIFCKNGAGVLTDPNFYITFIAVGKR